MSQTATVDRVIASHLRVVTFSEDQQDATAEILKSRREALPDGVDAEAAPAEEAAAAEAAVPAEPAPAPAGQ